MLVPTLEVGGSHIAAALVDTESTVLPPRPHRFAVDAQGSAARIVRQLLAAADSLGAPSDCTWAVAIPAPFDYHTGVAEFDGVGKFDKLRGTSLRTALIEGVAATPADVFFCNDADAFALGESVHRGFQRRMLGLTLGTGVGSGWIDAGRVVRPAIPPDGRVDRLHVAGLPLEERMSTRAILRAYMAAGGAHSHDVAAICRAADAGQPVARQVLRSAFNALGTAIGGPARGFGASLIVVGGSIARSWSLCERWFRQSAGPLPDVAIAYDSERSALLGAAHAACQPHGCI